MKQDHHAREGNGELKGREISDGPIPDSDAPRRSLEPRDMLVHLREWLNTHRELRNEPFAWKHQDLLNRIREILG